MAGELQKVANDLMAALDEGVRVPV